MYEENPGTAKLASVMANGMRDSQRRNLKKPFDYGTVDDEYNLVTDNFKLKIPQKDYHVLREMTELVIGSEAADSAGDAHMHKYKTKYLMPGDRVLVARVGNEFCILGHIRPGTELRAEEAM